MINRESFLFSPFWVCRDSRPRSSASGDDAVFSIRHHVPCVILGILAREELILSHLGRTSSHYGGWLYSQPSHQNDPDGAHNGRVNHTYINLPSPLEKNVYWIWRRAFFLARLLAPKTTFLVVLVYLFVYFSRITNKVMNGFAGSFYQRCISNGKFVKFGG